jgi:hypothetical protein
MAIILFYFFQFFGSENLPKNSQYFSSILHFEKKIIFFKKKHSAKIIPKKNLDDGIVSMT